MRQLTHYIKQSLRLMRVHHWVKNLLIFFPAVFSKNLLNPGYMATSLYGFFCFSLLCSIVYIINDINDIEKDALHSTKRLRPLPSGAITKKQAFLLLFLLAALEALLLIPLIQKGRFLSLGILGGYLLINLFYSRGGKKVPILDILLLAMGYVLRLYFGSSLTGIQLSSWMTLTIMAAAFYLVLGKRRNETLRETSTRPVLAGYTPAFLDKSMYLTLTMALVFYSLWCKDMGELLILSIPLLLSICFKYNLTLEKGGDGDPISMIFRDKVLLALVAVFLLYVLVCLYLIV